MTPVNFLFQQSLESALPAYPTNDPRSTKIKVDDGGKGVAVEKKLNIRNTVSKIMVDQTVAAAMNTVAFLGVVPVLKGASTGQAWEGIKHVSGIGAGECDSDEAGRSPAGAVGESRGDVIN